MSTPSQESGDFARRDQMSRVPSKIPNGTPQSKIPSHSVGGTPLDWGTPSDTASVGRRAFGDTPQSRTPKPDATESERVKVVLRVRPALPNFSEGRDEHAGALELSETGVTLFRPDAPVAQSEFVFDKVLRPTATQHDVYMAGVKDVVDDVLLGYNGTVMAYGQTGAGKTYTLGNTEPTAIGMIPRCVAEIFKQAQADPFHTFSVSMSYIQIYMELIQDLLKPESENLAIREDASNGVFIAGVHEVAVASLEECLHYLELGEKNRTFAFTHLNAHSSRSHAVVMVTVVKSRKYLTATEKAEIKKTEKDGMISQKVKVGKLYLVDLAGSERLKKSRSVGLRASEAKSINLSLTTLGMCISARANDERHVPFRDSKLTRLLQESLGGNAKTTLLVCVADAKQHVDESLQSLQFGSRAMCVKNKPVVNERFDYRVLHAELMAQMDKTDDRAHELEVAILRTEEERDALRVALDHEKEHFEAIIGALRSEGEERVAAVANELMSTREAVGMEAAKREELESRVRQVEGDNAAMAEVHYQTVTSLKAQIKDLLSAQAAAATEHRREAMQAASELSETQHQLALAQAHGNSLEQENDSLRAELSTLKAAQAQWHIQLAQLRQAMAEALPDTLPGPIHTSVFIAPVTDTQAATSEVADSTVARSHATSSLASVMAALGGSRSAASNTAPAPGSAAATVQALIRRESATGPASASAVQAPAAEVPPGGDSTSGWGSGGGSVPEDGTHLAPSTPAAAPVTSTSADHALNGDAEEDVTGTDGGSISLPAIDSSMGGAESSVSLETRFAAVTPVRSGAGVAIPDLALSGTPAAIHQHLTSVVGGLMPRLAHALSALAESNGARGETIAVLEGEVAAGLGREAALTEEVVGLARELEDVREDLRQEKETCEGLREEVSGLKLVVAGHEEELASRAEQLERLGNELEDVNEQLAEEQEQHGQLKQLHASVQTQRHEIHVQSMDVRTRTRAAAVIQRSYRKWRDGKFKAKAIQDFRALHELNHAREEAAHAAHMQAAQLGAGMLLDSMTVIRDAVEALLTTFVGRRRELELREQLANRVASAAPMLSHARLNTALSCLPSQVASTASSPSHRNLAAPSAPPGAPPERRLSYGSRAAAVMHALSGRGNSRSQLRTLGGGSGTGGGAMTSGPMTLPRSVTLAASYSAVAPTMTEFTQPVPSVEHSLATSPTRTAGFGAGFRSMGTTRRATTEAAGVGTGQLLRPGTAGGGVSMSLAVCGTGTGTSLSVADSLSAAAATLRQQRPATSGTAGGAAGASSAGGAALIARGPPAPSAGEAALVAGEVGRGAADVEGMDEHDPSSVTKTASRPIAAHRGGLFKTGSILDSAPSRELPYGTPGGGAAGAAMPQHGGIGKGGLPSSHSLDRAAGRAGASPADQASPGYSAYYSATGASLAVPSSPGGASVTSGIGRFHTSQSPVKSAGGVLGVNVTPTLDMPSAGPRVLGTPGSVSRTEGGDSQGDDGSQHHGKAARSLMGALRRAANSFRSSSRGGAL